MLNQHYIRKVTITEDFAAIEAGRTIFSGVINCPPGNNGNVIFEGHDGSEVPWIPGEWNEFRSVDLSLIRVKGTAGDTVTLNGWGN